MLQQMFTFKVPCVNRICTLFNDWSSKEGHFGICSKFMNLQSMFRIQDTHLQSRIYGHVDR